MWKSIKKWSKYNQKDTQVSIFLLFIITLCNTWHKVEKGRQIPEIKDRHSRATKKINGLGLNSQYHETHPNSDHTHLSRLY